MKKASALTAALSGAPAPAAAAAPPSRKTFLDPAAFPCVAYAAENEGVAMQTTQAFATLHEEFEQMDISTIPVGSAPTSILSSTPGVVLTDYPLNPRRRRGGQEVFPISASMDERSSRFTSSSLSSNFLNDAIIGSLPKGLTSEEKMKVLQSTPMSPSRALLQEMSNTAAIVSSRTADGRKMRRQVLKGAVMVFVTAGYSGKRFIFEKAKELGVRTVVLDGPDSWVQLLVEQGIIEKFVPIDFSDADTVYDRCLAAIKLVQKEVGELDGITTFCEIAVPLASRLAEQLGLPCNTPEAVDNARDKHATRSIMEKAGLPTPKHYKISTPEDVSKAASHVGFPAVIKPISGAASIGVIRVDNIDQLNAAYKRVLHDMSRARIVAGALLQGDDESEETGGNAGSWIQLVLMLEEYLDGDEVDCDLIFSGGVPVFGAITDNWPTVEPYFNETGSNCPSILPLAVQVQLLELSVQAVQALGFKMGVFHVESKQTSRGPRLIEVNCRMGGGPVRDTNLLVWGVDLVEENLMAFAGIPVRPPIPKRPLKYIAEYSINAKVTGIITNDTFMAPLQDVPEVLYARPLVSAGQRCVCVDDGLPTWVAELMVSCSTVAEAIAMAKKIEAELVIPIEVAA